MDKGKQVLEIIREIRKEKEIEMAEKATAGKAPLIRETDNGKEKRCPKCEKYHPADREHFYKDGRGKLGLSSWCIGCQGKGQSGASQAGNGKKAEKQTEGAATLMIDFSGREPLLEELKTDAYNELRTPEMHAMFLIKTSITRPVRSTEND